LVNAFFLRIFIHDMEKLLIPVDKANHFIAGTLIYCLASLILTPAAALIPVVVIGAGKEMYDKYSKKGTPDLVDFIFTVLGALPVLLTLVAK
jgi:hypothetical protein